MERSLELLMHKMDAWVQGRQEEVSSDRTMTDKGKKPMEVETTSVEKNEQSTHLAVGKGLSAPWSFEVNFDELLEASFMGYVELGKALALHEGIAYAFKANICPLRDEIDFLIL
ncbi:unnamed protein product [Citrullus colocynthis]|uniref:Uncharacterized protein n=1 Tax=Citrullus colocynthis TaxID=252529 RepID=A0ABP0Z020_9ROSI